MTDQSNTKPAGGTVSRREAVRTAAAQAPAPDSAAADHPRIHDPVLTEDDLYLFNEGTHYRLYDKLGAHPMPGAAGHTHFAVWAPGAEFVSVIGDFNGWDNGKHPLRPRGQSGIWQGTIEGVTRGTVYKYHVVARNGHRVDKADPFALRSEPPPHTASVVWELEYVWSDADWMAGRHRRNALDAPLAIYEVHLGSWMRVPEENNRFLTYRELAPRLCEHVQRVGFTHVEFLPVMEHPFYGSWGYQVTGYFAPTARYGSPQDLMYLIDYLHQHDIGVILDWVPSHFPTDEYGLGYFDGTHLYEHADPRTGFHPEWKSFIFNYGRHEVRSFLMSSAMFWLDRHHADGLRVDGVASMLHLDYARQPGEWIPNEYGGRENLGAMQFLRQLNEAVFRDHPDVQTIAEESTSWPMVSRPTYAGGLGFGLKWDMGWMHDTLHYMSLDSVHRKYHHNELTFRHMYAYSENFVLPLSHDEVVYGKRSLLNKMPGDDWQRFANLRLLFGYMYATPGAKLLFMGGEFGQWNEWSHDQSLDWHLLGSAPHAQLQRWVGELNRLYRSEPALHARDHHPDGFEWIDCSDNAQSVLVFLRKGPRANGHGSDAEREVDAAEQILVACNFTPVPRYNYRVGVPAAGFWKELLNSDAREYGGSGHGNLGGVESVPIPIHGRRQSVVLTLPPLAAILLKWSGAALPGPSLASS